MTKSSVYFGSILSRMNDSQIDNPAHDNPDGLVGRVSGVSWWQVGSDVYAMSEYKDGHKVDPHNLKWISGSDYGPGLDTAPSFPECNEDCSIRSSLNPAHETYDDDLGKVIDSKYYKKLGVGLKKVFFEKNSAENHLPV